MYRQHTGLRWISSFRVGMLWARYTVPVFMAREHGNCVATFKLTGATAASVSSEKPATLCCSYQLLPCKHGTYYWGMSDVRSFVRPFALCRNGWTHHEVVNAGWRHMVVFSHEISWCNSSEQILAKCTKYIYRVAQNKPDYSAFQQSLRKFA